MVLPYRPELDGIRGIAILLVLLFHFQLARPAALPYVFTLPASLGWSGVDLFFVLSGFLITGILLETRAAPNYFSSFYARRVLRIFPLYVVCIFAYFAWSNTSGQVWYWLHISNWRSAFGHDVEWLSHLWSLAIEEQFYLVWPLLVLWVRPSRFAYVCAATIIIAIGLRLMYADSGLGREVLHRLTPFRMDSLAVGAVMAVMVRDPALAWLRRALPLFAVVSGAFLIYVCCVADDISAGSRWMEKWGYTAFAVLYSYAIVSATAVPFLRWKPLRALGKYSYAMYLFHWPIAVYLTPYLDGLSYNKVALYVASPLMGGLASFGLAVASWHLIEKHFLKLKSRFVALLPEESLPQPSR